MAIEFKTSNVLADDYRFRSERPPEPFNDIERFGRGSSVYVTGMKIFIRKWDDRFVIGAIQVTYNTGASVLHGSVGQGFDSHEFHLDPDERITTVNARAGFVTDQLEFITNRKNIYGPYGGEGGSLHQLKSPKNGAYLAYVTGTVEFSQGNTVVRNLCFVWGYRKG